MRRVLLRLLLALGLSVTLSSAAAAAVHVRAVVSPDSLPQCSMAHWSAALWNDGADTVCVRVSITLIYRDSLPLGTLIGRTTLLPGEVRARDFDVRIPARMPAGRYALALRAVGSNGSEDHATARFTVLAADCPPPPAAADPGLAVMSGVSQGLSLEPDSATPTLHNTWGQLKVRYRN